MIKINLIQIFAYIAFFLSGVMIMVPNLRIVTKILDTTILFGIALIFVSLGGKEE